MTHVTSAALAIAVCVLTAVPASAQPRRPLDAPSRAAVARAAARGEAIRVIVRLNERFVVEGALTAAGVSAQRERIARAEARVLSGPAGRHVFRSRRFQTIPYASMQIDAAAFDQLATDPAIAGIEIDRLERVSLAESTALIQAASTTAGGYRGAGWNIATLDTGVERGHSFFGGRVVYEACFSTTDSAGSISLCPSGADEQTGPGAATPCTISSACEHGTHVAGIAAGSGDEFSGVAPAAGILAFQVFSRFDSAAICENDAVPCIRTHVSDQVEALERVYLLRDAMKIAAVNMSFGAGEYPSQAACDADNASRKAAIDNLRSANIATVASAGNNGYPGALGAPACISGVISVGATTDLIDSPLVSSFSNSATFLSLLAPGTSITSSLPGNTFGERTGTSMAAPHVTGAWAVLMSAAPTLSVRAVLDVLRTTGVAMTDANDGRADSQGIVKSLIQLGSALNTLGIVKPGLQSTPDINSDGFADLIWQNRAEGYMAAWIMDGLSLTSSDLFSPPRVTDPQWRIAATADVDGDGKLDLVWQEESQGWIGIWKMNGLALVSSLALSVERVPDTDWKIVAAQDFNGDDKADIVWHHRTQGYLALWYMDGATVVDSVLFSPGQVTDTNWQIEAAADFNADGKPDLLWRHQTLGWVTVWLMDGLSLQTGRDVTPNQVADTNWRIASVVDLNRDGAPDIVWQDVANGWIAAWLMQGTSLMQSIGLDPDRVSDTNWRIVGPR